MKRFVLWILLVAVFACPSALGQGTRADYERSAGLAELTRGKVLNHTLQANWLEGGGRFWYRKDLQGGRSQYVLVDAEKGTRGPAFDHARLAAALSKATGKAVAADRIAIDRMDMPGDGKSLLLRCAGRSWKCSLSDYALAPYDGPIMARGPSRPRRRSSRRGEETFLTFINRSGREVELFWLADDGDRRSYGKLAAGARYEQHTFSGHAWLAVDDKGNVLGRFVGADEPTEAVIEPPATRPTTQPARARRERDAVRAGPRSPDGRYEAFFRDHNLYLRERAGGREHALTSDGKADDAYGGEVYWSPDSSRVVVFRTRPGDSRRVYYVESSPRDQLQPKLHSYEYLKPGDQLPHPRPCLFDAAGRKQIPVADDLFANPYELTRLRWAGDSGSFSFLYNQRGHQAMRLIVVDAASGRARAAIDEPCRTFFDYAHKLFLHRIDATGEAIWMSERDGWNHLYLCDLVTGKVKNPITRGPWVVRSVERVDEEKRQVWFRCGGIAEGLEERGMGVSPMRHTGVSPVGQGRDGPATHGQDGRATVKPPVVGQDPYFIHYGRVNFDGSGLTVLTEGEGTHGIEYSPDGRFFVDSYSRVDLAPVHELRRSRDGSLVCELERADASALRAAGWREPEPFAAKGRDGKTDIYGVIFTPTTFDAKKKYPVLEEIYAGPQGNAVPKSFRAYHSAQAMAELGFVVVKIDGTGTSNRSKAFHDVCWKNIGDAGLDDRVAWMKAAGATRGWMDLSRVGVYGTSAGGQNAMRALITHGDFYKAAVADCGCHDNRMDKIWWNELWMGWPVGPHYAENSNVTLAHKLRGKLLLIVGELDDNVDPASTMQVVRALIDADKDFELLVIPGAGHGAAGTPYGHRRLQDFFVRNLLGVEPRRGPDA